MNLHDRTIFQLPALIGMALTLHACTSQKQVTTSAEVPAAEVVAEPEITERPHYNESRERTFDLIHTKLDVRFNFAAQTMDGKAELTLKPYFYSTNKLVLDAKAFELRTVGIKGKNGINALRYDYDGQQMTITLDREYNRNDTIRIWVDYTARPEEVKSEGSAAITDAKGLYFINPKGEDPKKPVQVWTQGETEASSCWFPTIDSPNENTTQEIVMTVPSKYVSLSNGLLTGSKDNGDGTRTDTWKQKKPHAPYLAMMAVGDFAVIKDKWKGLNVDYYVEHDYAIHAKQIFGETPAMLDFYSDVLDYPYTWEKYAQIVVRDYVSGAMENTSAVIHGEFLHRTDRELLDGDNERIIAHELFHHWFGDLVTCENWANLPLNESFATYGEYMWMEHRHGRAAADHHSEEQMGQYFASAKQQGHVDLIRFNYEDKEDMFDAHSYNKGGRVLHMLRKAIGDDAFYRSLNLYLKTNEHEAVEIHQLRLAVEKVTGQDMNWFFNQWFLSKGHPELKVERSFDAAALTYSIILTQEQDLKQFPLYRLPMDVDIYAGGVVNRERIVLDSKVDTFTFKLAHYPDLVIVDAERMLLGTVKDELSEGEYIFQLVKAPLFKDKAQALNALRKSDNVDAMTAMLLTLEHEDSGIRQEAVKALRKAAVADTSLLKNRLIVLTQGDSKAAVRAEALSALAERFGKDTNVRMIIENATNDRSYNVAGSALRAIATYDTDKALALAKAAEKDAKGSLVSAIAAIYIKHGGAEQLDFFVNGFKNISDPGEKYAFVQTFGKYLFNQDAATRLLGLDLVEDIALNEDAWYLRLSAIQVLAGMQQTAEADPANNADLLPRVKAIMDKVKATETNEMIQGMLGK
ncbi:MAG: M1 family metallopeptidase [Flavobacteriales bacterium]|nr:M1 family metallopeptidase [Flavobacteriales bacterium]